MDTAVREELDRVVEGRRRAAGTWARTAPGERADLLRSCRGRFARVASAWAARCARAKGSDPEGRVEAEELLLGPYFILRNLRLLEHSLRAIEKTDRPGVPGPVRVRPSGQVTVRAFPFEGWDRLFYAGVTAEVWMEPGITAENLEATQAVAYHDGRDVETELVLGAGNVSSIAPMDVLHELFVANRVAVLKMHPVNASLRPLLEEAFRPLLAVGVLGVVEGGAKEGAYLCEHPGVDGIHVTGSDRTYEAIVFGGGEEGERRKAERRPRTAKRVTGELGNVSPVIVVPGPWSEADFRYHAANVATMLANNAGFNCNAARVLVTASGWPGRDRLLDGIRRVFRSLPPREAWYPGAADRHRAFLDRHPEAERFGGEGEGSLPWTFIPGVDADRDGEICFRTEAFCSIVAETPLDAPDVPGFLDRAVEFANERLWGTLNATILLHPRTLRERGTAAALDRALERLRYGTVSLNHWAALGFGLVVTPWGAFPGHPPWDIQSGTGFVHNTPMFSRARKTVLRAPFRARPRPLWFVNHRNAKSLAERLVRFEAAPAAWKVPGITLSAVRG